MEDRKFLFISLLVSFVLMFGAVLFLSKGSTGSKKNIDTSLLTKEGANTKGVEGAKIIIVEFSDFACPACKVAKTEVDKVLEAYKENARLVYRHMPFHNQSMMLAEASEYAAENRKFWEFYDLIFSKQEEWAGVTDATKFDELLAGYVKSLGLDEKKLFEELKNNTYLPRVQKDVDDGGSLGIFATPTFFVNGEETNGYSFEEFKRLIEKNL